MSKPACMWAVVLAVTVLSGMQHTATASTDYGLGLLLDIMNTDPTQLCSYVSCQEPVSPGSCPDSTTYLENAAQFGCCGACVSFNQEGEPCTGSIDPLYGGGYTAGSSKRSVNLMESVYNVSENNILQSSWCDYNLECFTRDNKTFTCAKPPTNTACRNMLDNYLEDIMSSDYKPWRDDYRWEPVCAQDGKFDVKQCIGPRDKPRCVCVDPDGNRIFGLAFPEQEELYNTMNCKCSRAAWEKRQAGETAVTLHCQENGNYEELQCQNKWCYCVDPVTGDLYGSRLPESAMHMLPCYNQTIIGEMYLRRCDSELYAHAKLLDAMTDSGVRGPESFAKCDQDGSFSSKQCDQTMCRCYDKYFYQSIAHPSGDDCQCAEDIQYYTEINAKITVLCKVNTGAYAEEQTQGDSFKFCVDEDGIRSGPLVYSNQGDYTLDCANAKLCQEKGASGGDFCSETCVAYDGSPCPDEAYPNFSLA